MLTAGAAVAGTGVLVHNQGMVAMPILVAMGWVFWAVKDSAAPVRGARPVPGAAPYLPILYVAYEAVPTRAHFQAMSVAATHEGSSRFAWFSGGGLGLTRDGMITASDGRNLVMAWETQPGGVSRAVANQSDVQSGLHETPQTGPTRVVEVAVVGQGSLVYAVYLRNERGEQLAALPAAGLDGRRVAALARAAGVHYRRYRVDVATPRFSGAADADCFPLAASFSRFRGPGAPVSLGTWTLGEREAAGGASS